MNQARRDALLEWVRRGGKLVLSVGRNQQSVARWLEKVPLVDGTLKSKITRSTLPNLQAWCGADRRSRNNRSARSKSPASSRGRTCTVSSAKTQTAGDLETRPILLQSSCGLGRVLLVAFDLDAPPFSTWDGQGAFWKKLQDEIAPRVVAGDVNLPAGPFAQGGELGIDLKRELESFEDVPVISFGWVALFILFYIVLVGPLDYFILKKVFKRLELTWITFPVLVLIVSVAAYATAYYVKGDDLRINKIDLVEIDLHGPGQVYGQSWFTLFSPRIQNYTIGLEPVAPEWGGRWTRGRRRRAGAAGDDGGAGRTGAESAAATRRACSAGPTNTPTTPAACVRVPIPVWATRTFTASWRVPLQRPRGQGSARRRSRRSCASAETAGRSAAPSPTICRRSCKERVLFFQGQWYLAGRSGARRVARGRPAVRARCQAASAGRSGSPMRASCGRASARCRPGQQRSWPALSSYETCCGRCCSTSARRRRSHPTAACATSMKAGGCCHREKDHSGVTATRRSWSPARRRASTRPRPSPQDGVSPTRLWLDELPGHAAATTAAVGLSPARNVCAYLYPFSPQC